MGSQSQHPASIDVQNTHHDYYDQRSLQAAVAVGVDPQAHNGVRETQRQAEMIALSTAMFSEAFSVQTMLEHLLQRSVRVTCKRDNLGVVQISKSGYSAKLRHAPRVHRVNISSVHEISGEFCTYNRIYPNRRTDRQWFDQGYSANRLAEDAHATLHRRLNRRCRLRSKVCFCRVIVLNALRSAPEIALQVRNHTRGGSWRISLSPRVVYVLYRRLLIPLNLPLLKTHFGITPDTLAQGKRSLVFCRSLCCFVALAVW